MAARINAAAARVTEASIDVARHSASRHERAGPVLIAVSIALIMVQLDGVVVAVANPAIAVDLHAPLSAMQWVSNAYLIALSVAVIPAGDLGDRYGRKRVFLVGVGVFSLASVGCATSPAVEMLIGFRAAQGVAAAMLMANGVAILRQAFAGDRLGQALGVATASSAVALTGGSVFAGAITGWFGWQAVFLINLVIGPAALLVGCHAIRHSREALTGQVDVTGLALLSAGLLAVMWGLVGFPAWALTSVPQNGLILGGAVLLLLFGWFEARFARAPLLPPGLIRSRLVSAGAVLLAIYAFAFFGFIFFITLYLHNIRGYGFVSVGVHLLPLTAAAGVAGLTGAGLARRAGPRVPIVLGMVLTAAALVALAALNTAGGFWAFAPWLALVGLGAGWVQVAAMQIVVGGAEPRYVGTVGGLQGLAVQAGGALGVAVLGSTMSTTAVSRFFDRVAASGYSDRVGAAASTRYVSEGLAPPASGGQTAEDVLRAAAHDAFLFGLDVVLMVSACGLLIGALLALLVVPGRRGRRSGRSMRCHAR
jgi:EmrB/QacA subfamily drug resistance transporter